MVRSLRLDFSQRSKHFAKRHVHVANSQLLYYELGFKVRAISSRWRRRLPFLFGANLLPFRDPTIVPEAKHLRGSSRISFFL